MKEEKIKENAEKILKISARLNKTETKRFLSVIKDLERKKINQKNTDGNTISHYIVQAYDDFSLGYSITDFNNDYNHVTRNMIRHFCEDYYDIYK